VVYADKSDYNIDESKIILIGNIKLLQNNNILVGDKLIYDVKKEHTQIFSKTNQNQKDNARVKAVIKLNQDEQNSKE
jgi:lipopolysaccharide transport protein LptA